MKRRRGVARKVPVRRPAPRDDARRTGENLALAGAATVGVSGFLYWLRRFFRRSAASPAELSIERSAFRKSTMASTSTETPEHRATGHDVAPGDDKFGHEGVGAGIRGYLIGLGLAALLTAASFFVAGTNLIYGPGIPVALIVLAIAQMGVHLVFFLHITTGPDNTNNTMALAFGVLIVVLVVGGSIWIMQNLNTNMTPMDPNAMIGSMPM